MLLLNNPVKAYDWGRVDGIADLVGSEPSHRPEAELWVGTHAGGPSVLAGDADGRTLADVVAADPTRWLGAELAGAGKTELPFLLKVLAVGAPLSLQAHPSAEQAEDGFAREEAAGVPLDARRRTYRDVRAKPEALVALTDTWALCGFRDPAEAAELVAALGAPVLEPLEHTLREGDGQALRRATAWLARLQSTGRDAVVTSVAGAVGDIDTEDRSDPRAWICQLLRRHPGDPMVVAPLLLDLVHLSPGEAVHLPAGNLHAYLQGAGIEVMAASDNVVRGGLTTKHVDVEELLAIVRFEPGVPPAPSRTQVGPGIVTYDAGEAEFGLVAVDPGGGTVAIEPSGPSLLLATGGAVRLESRDGAHTIDHGDAAFCPPGEGPVAVSGQGRLWWATTGTALPR